MSLQKKIIVCEVIANMESMSVIGGAPFETRLGFRVLEIYNTTDYKIGEGLTKEQIDYSLSQNVSVVIRGKVYAANLDNPTV